MRLRPAHLLVALTLLAQTPSARADDWSGVAAGFVGLPVEVLLLLPQVFLALREETTQGQYDLSKFFAGLAVFVGLLFGPGLLRMLSLNPAPALFFFLAIAVNVIACVAIGRKRA